MNCYYFHIVLIFDCEIYYPGYVAEIGAFRLGGGGGSGVINIAIN